MSKNAVRELNRSAIAVTPRQPFLDWLHSADPTSSELTLNDLSQEPTIYLESRNVRARRLSWISFGKWPLLFSKINLTHGGRLKIARYASLVSKCWYGS